MPNKHEREMQQQSGPIMHSKGSRAQVCGGPDSRPPLHTRDAGPLSTQSGASHAIAQLCDQNRNRHQKH